VIIARNPGISLVNARSGIKIKNGKLRSFAVNGYKIFSSCFFSDIVRFAHDTKGLQENKLPFWRGEDKAAKEGEAGILLYVDAA
jgi:hypothetical protein